MCALPNCCLNPTLQYAVILTLLVFCEIVAGIAAAVEKGQVSPRELLIALNHSMIVFSKIVGNNISQWIYGYLSGIQWQWCVERL